MGAFPALLLAMVTFGPLMEQDLTGGKPETSFWFGIPCQDGSPKVCCLSEKPEADRAAPTCSSGLDREGYYRRPTETLHARNDEDHSPQSKKGRPGLNTTDGNSPKKGSGDGKSRPPFHPPCIAVTPQQLLEFVTDQPSSFKLDVTVDRFDGTVYFPGEIFTVDIWSEKEGYVFLFEIDPGGFAQLLFPRGGECNRVPAKRVTTLRPRTAARGFQISWPKGIVQIIAVVCSRPLALGSFVYGVVPYVTSQCSPGFFNDQHKVDVPRSATLDQTSIVEQTDSASKTAAARSLLTSRLGECAHDVVVFFVDNEQGRDRGQGATNSLGHLEKHVQY